MHYTHALAIHRSPLGPAPCSWRCLPPLALQKKVWASWRWSVLRYQFRVEPAIRVYVNWRWSPSGPKLALTTITLLHALFIFLCCLWSSRIIAPSISSIRNSNFLEVIEPNLGASRAKVYITISQYMFERDAPPPRDRSYRAACAIIVTGTSYPDKYREMIQIRANGWYFLQGLSKFLTILDIWERKHKAFSFSKSFSRGSYSGALNLKLLFPESELIGKLSWSYYSINQAMNTNRIWKATPMQFILKINDLHELETLKAALTLKIGSRKNGHRPCQKLDGYFARSNKPTRRFPKNPQKKFPRFLVAFAALAW